jgi:hypothetical protein
MPLSRILIAALMLSGAVMPALAQRVATPIIHPLCVQQIAAMTDNGFQAVDAQPVAVAECNRRHAETPVEYRGDVASATPAGVTDTRPPFYQYRVIGRVGDATVLDVSEGTGGTGVFSALVFVAGWPDAPNAAGIDDRANLRQVGLLEGGDRCNGGISSASVTDRALRVSERITPFDLITIRASQAIRRNAASGVYEIVDNTAAPALTPKLAALQPYQDLDTAATSCVGFATIDYHLDRGNAELVSITVNRLVDNNPASARHRHQACFNRVARTMIPNFPQTLSPPQVAALSQRFETECLK